jgi:hypothetical protein
MPWKTPQEFPRQSRAELERFDRQWVALLPNYETISDASAKVVVDQLRQRQVEINSVVFTYIQLGLLQ